MKTTTDGPRPRFRRRQRLGAGMIVAALAVGLFGGVTGSASAAEDPEPVKVEKTAYWTASLGHLAPNVLTSRFPPQIVCLVRPEACDDQVEEITAPVDTVLRDNQPETVVPGGDPAGLLVAPGTLPTAVIAGTRRHQSAVKFDVPALPSDHEYASFQLVLTETDPTYHFDSPAFRQFTTGVLALTRSDTAEIPKTVDEAPVSDVHLGIEACAFLVDWEAGDNQPGSEAPDSDSDEYVDGKLVEAEVDCGSLGALGERQDDGTWVFDLTFAANAWASGETPNYGILLRPVTPPNVAYGDPDLSTWDQVSFVKEGDGGPAATFETAEVSDNTFTLPPGGSIGGNDTTSGDDTSVQGATANRGSESFTEVFGSPADRPADTPAPPVEAPDDQVAASPASVAGAVTEWWVWLILPLLLGGTYLVTQGFTAEMALADERSGAMSRLLAQRRAAELEG